ncbi:MAG: hypothetical protein ACRDDY_17515 [Clostridium sp.]|uniref:hypothetical protein n=1 Tax=Clostridium sp. TaxID=1506 RepID=UPI003EE66074
MYKTSLQNFIKTLINETFNGIVSGSLDNEKILLELKTSLTLSNEEFAKKVFTDEDIRNESIKLFPSEVSSLDTLIDSGNIYIPASSGVFEFPSIKNITDYDMIFETDYIKLDSNFIITDVGYTNIIKKLSINMAISNKFLLSETFKNGFPKLLVESGTINANSFFSFEPSTSGLNYTTFTCINSKLQTITTGISKNLFISDSEFRKADIIHLFGYIYINTTDTYKILIQSNDSACIFINNIETNTRITLNKGFAKIFITYRNSKKFKFNLSLFLENSKHNIISINDDFLFLENPTPPNNFSYILNSSIPSNSSIFCKTNIDATALSSKEFISNFSINYKIIDN